MADEKSAHFVGTICDDIRQGFLTISVSVSLYLMVAMMMIITSLVDIFIRAHPYMPLTHVSNNVREEDGSRTTRSVTLIMSGVVS
jgi:hypothetical protein